MESSRTLTFLMNLEMVSDGKQHQSEASVKVSSRSSFSGYFREDFELRVVGWPQQQSNLALTRAKQLFQIGKAYLKVK